LVVTREILIRALGNTLGMKGMSGEDIVKLADYILSFFGFDDEIIDNKLTSEDRDVFYMLEEEGLLGTREEETQLKKGKPWRIHYWRLRYDSIKKLAESKSPVAKKESEYSIYDKMPANGWTRS
jgi:transcription initiation factor IIE alpha subunit